MCRFGTPQDKAQNGGEMWDGENIQSRSKARILVMIPSGLNSSFSQPGFMY